MIHTSRVAMRIDSKTPYAAIAEVDRYDLLDDESKQQVTDAAVKDFGSYWGMTINDLAAILNGDLSRLGDMAEPTILQVFWLKGFRSFIDEFTQAIERLTVPMDAEERRASEGLPSVSFIEGLLIFSKNYFRHHSFDQAGRTILSDIIIAKKDEYRSALSRKKWQAIQSEKMRHTNGKHH